MKKLTLALVAVLAVAVASDVAFARGGGGGQQAAPAPAYYWYYCTNPAGYYPYVQNCNDAWMAVVPQR
jgi:hypothetical protein